LRYKVSAFDKGEKVMTQRENKSAALRLAEEVQRRPLAAAAFIGARALARRNGAREGKPLNAVLAAAITACEAAAACNEGKESSS
jgi:hypothetical protein